MCTPIVILYSYISDIIVNSPKILKESKTLVLFLSFDE